MIAANTTEPASEIVDYDRLALLFEESLTQKLRGNRPEEQYLELWVPDSDPVKGVLNMIDAAFEAGRESIAIRIGTRLLPRERWNELRARGEAIARLEMAEVEDGVVVHARGMQAFRAETRKAQTGPDGGEYKWSGVIGAPPLSTGQKFIEEQCAAVAASQARREPRYAVTLTAGLSEPMLDMLRRRLSEYGSTDVGPTSLIVELDPAVADVAELPPTFRAGVNAAAHKLRREGHARAAGDDIVLEASEGGITLSVTISPKGHFIRQACHTGAVLPADRGVMDVFCEVLERLPIQEAAEHGGAKLLARLRDRSFHRPVRGIMGAVNAGPSFSRPVRLIRAIGSAYAKKTGVAGAINFYDAPPSDAWVKLPRDEQVARITATLADFLSGRGLAPDAMQFQSLQLNTKKWPVRVFVQFSAAVHYLEKPRLMMAFERRLKERVEDKLQVYNQEMADRSPLRRL